jgi:hypothetical protein
VMIGQQAGGRNGRAAKTEQLDSVERRLVERAQVRIGLLVRIAVDPRAPRMGAAAEVGVLALFGMRVEARDRRFQPLAIDADPVGELADRIGRGSKLVGPGLIGGQRGERIFLPRLAVDDYPAGEIGMGLTAAVDDVDLCKRCRGRRPRCRNACPCD